MANRPVLALLPPSVRPYEGKPRVIAEGVSRPDPDRQRSRLQPQFARLKQQFEQAIKLQIRPAGAEPEQVVVLETLGRVDDFIIATRNLAGMELLGEWDEDDVPPDDDFFKLNQKEERTGGSVPGRLYLVMTDQQAMKELLSLWDRYQTNPATAFERGKGKFKEIFERLKTVRLWGPEDRLIERGGIDVWTQELVSNADGLITAQIEMWFRQSDTAREKLSNIVRGLINEVGGTTEQELVLEEIRYHVLLASLPPNTIKELVGKKPLKLIQYEQIMFVRAAAQFIVPSNVELTEEITTGSQPAVKLPPAIALLDGMPLENHQQLSGKLIVDDPDNVASRYSAASRQHGTAMASLIVHGDLNKPSLQLMRPIYVRPILEPSADGSTEWISNNVLPVDLLHRAVRRIYEPEGTTPPVASAVRVINLSICDSARPFDLYPGPLARLIDWLSYKYNVLFIVSAGNCSQNLPLTREFEGKELGKATVRSIATDLRNRRLLSPAESVNALTVGALHADDSNENPIGELFDALPLDGAASPISAVGFGFRRSIKPDVLMPGGRQFFKPSRTNGFVSIADTDRFGIRVACSSTRPGEINKTRRIRGTSAAAALASHSAGVLYESLLDLNRTGEFNDMKAEYYSVILKALMVHRAEWGEVLAFYEEALKTKENSQRFKEYLSRFLGYGSAVPTRSLTTTDQSATMIGWGEIEADHINTFTIPLPNCLSGKKLWRRLTITLAWLTPINSGHRAYRKAALSFAPPHSLLQVERRNADWRAVQRGSIQHEILEGEKAVAFKKDDELGIEITCRASAGELPEKVKYGLVVSLEVEEGMQLPVWQEISNILAEIRERIKSR